MFLCIVLIILQNCKPMFLCIVLIILQNVATSSIIIERGALSRECVCVWCVFVFIKLHITAQSGPVILVILCQSH